MIKSKKYDFAKQELRFLEYIIFKNRIRINSEKIAKMLLLSLLINFKQLQFRLEFFSFYHKYIKGFSDITQFIYKLIRKDNETPVLFE